MIDIVNQKAIYWGPGEANEGLNYEITEIPAELKERAKAALAELIDAVSNKDDEIAELGSRRKTDYRPKSRRRRFAVSPAKLNSFPFCAVRRSRKRACRFWWMPSWIICRVRSTFPARKASSRARKIKSTSKRTTTINFVRSRSNFGPTLTRANWFSSAFIPAILKKGDTYLQSAHAQTRARQPPHGHPGQRAQGHQRSLCRRHRRARRSAQHHDGRHALRRKLRRDARTADVSRTRHLDGRRAEDETGSRQDVRGLATSRRGRPDVPLFHERGNQPAHHRGHGRVASGNHH